MSTKSKRRNNFRPRKKISLFGPREVTFYIVRFMVKVPEEAREDPAAPAWIKRESDPTLDEAQARAAYRSVIDELMVEHADELRSPQLLVRTVTEDVLRDYDHEHGTPGDEGLTGRLDAANTETAAQERPDLDAVLDALAGTPEVTP